MRKVIFPLLFLFFVSCDYYDSKLHIINNSDNLIYVKIEQDTILSDPINSDFGYANPNYKILPDSSKRFIQPGSPNAWDQYLIRSKDTSITCFIFLKDTLDKYSWETIKEMELYSYKQTLKLEELKKKNWIIEFHCN